MQTDTATSTTPTKREALKDFSIMQKASVKLVYKNPFYGHLLMAMVKVEDPSLPAPMGVSVKDGLVYLHYNPAMLDLILEAEKNFDVILGIVEHECLHVIFRHFLRQADRSAVMMTVPPILAWNIAADMAINQMIDKPMPKGVVSHKDFKFPPNLTAEQYYDLLMKNCQQFEGMSIRSPKGQAGEGEQEGQGGGQGDGDEQQDGDGQDGGGGGPRMIDDHSGWKQVDGEDAKNNDLENAAVKALVQKAAEQASKRQGHLPSQVEQEIKKLLAPPTIPWQRILRQYVGGAMKVAHTLTWKRVSRRFGERQKGKRAVKSIKIVCAIDTSGSMGERELQMVMSEIYAIRNSYKCKIEIIECDAAVHKHYELRKDIDVKFKGRGGTSFVPVFDFIEENNLRPGLVIYLTDMYGSFPDRPPRYPVIWVQTPGRPEHPPWGRWLQITKAEGDRDDYYDDY